MSDLKEKLLNTTYFIDNDYLDKYINLVLNNAVSQSVFSTQTHHIIPKTYFKSLNLPIDDSSDNLVELLFKDHVKAHWLLFKSTIGFLHRNSGYALRYMLTPYNTNKYKDDLTETDFEELQQLYEDSILSIEKNQFIEYYKNHSCKETASKFNIGLNTVTRLAKEYNCLKNIRRSKASSRTIIDKDILYKYYIIENHSLVETATYFNVDKSTILRRLQDLNLQQNKNAYRHAKRSDYVKEPINKEAFIKYYASHSLEATAIYFNMSKKNVEKYVTLYKINKKVTKDFDYAAIIANYKQFGLTNTLNKYNISKTHLYRIVKQEANKSAKNYN